ANSSWVPADDVVVFKPSRVEVADVSHPRATGTARIDDQAAEPPAAIGRALRNREGDSCPVRGGIVRRREQGAARESMTTRLPVEPLSLIARQSGTWRWLGETLWFHLGDGPKRPPILRRLWSRHRSGRWCGHRRLLIWCSRRVVRTPCQHSKQHRQDAPAGQAVGGDRKSARRSEAQAPCQDH